MIIQSTDLVDDVMRKFPVTIRVFLQHKMHCVGCPMTRFNTVEDACREHGNDGELFIADLRAAAQIDEGIAK